ncbi:hypothetical protein AGMMS49982_23950 [Bacteroidia bacterium]|nr:hypothetical protein AGMMS49982_23950 [Bacteroidia bacterium]
MKEKVNVIFGEEQVNKIHNGETLTPDERSLYMKTYSFDSIAEKGAFCHGIHEAVGWVECCIEYAV